MFGWTERFNVAAGVAHALDYLHGNGNTRSVIHRDVKSSNILISEDFEPKVTYHPIPEHASVLVQHLFAAMCNIM
jgi:serine/threonine protein kinase